MNYINTLMYFLVLITMVVGAGIVWYEFLDDLRLWFKENVEGLVVTASGVVITELLLSKTWEAAQTLYHLTF